MKVLLIALLLSGCYRVDVMEQRVANVEVLTAMNRRDEVVREIARIRWLTRFTSRSMENRIALDIVIVERQAELERLNAIIGAR